MRQLLVLLVAALCFPTLSMAADHAAPTPVERAAAIAQPSIAYLAITFSSRLYDQTNHSFVRDEPFSVTYQCTGFFVNPNGWVATAGHCVAFDDQAKVDLEDAGAAWAYDVQQNDPVNRYYNKADFTQQELTDLVERSWVPRGGHSSTIKVSWGVAASGIGQPRTLPARLSGFKAFERGDVALLKIDATNLPSLKLDTDASVEVGEDIIAIGYPVSVDNVTDPNSFNPSFKSGTISSKKTIGNGLVGVYEISAPVSGGMSGGPTVDTAGSVLGVNSFGIRDEPQAFNFVTPSALVLELMRDKGVSNQLGDAARLYRDGLDAYWARDRNKAISKFDQALQIAPSFASAQDFRAKAALLPKPKKTFPWLWVIIGLLVLAAVAAAVAALMMRRRRPAAGESSPAVIQSRPSPPSPPAETRDDRLKPGPPPARAPAAPTVVSRPSVPMLVVENGNLDGPSRHPIAADTIIGRDGDIVVDDPEASRRHARVRLDDQSLTVEDLQSANGTEINGKRISSVTLLRDGDVITVGGTKLRVVLPAVPAGRATTVRSRPDTDQDRA